MKKGEMIWKWTKEERKGKKKNFLKLLEEKWIEWEK